MSLFDQTKTVVPLSTIGGTAMTLGGQPVRLTIPRQSRRLQKIRVHLNISVSTALTGNSAVGVAGLLNTVKLIVSDAAGSNRAAIDTRGATLHVLARKWDQTLGRFTQLATATPALAAGSYQMFWTIPVRYPLLDDPIGYRTSMPLDENFAQADPVLELTTTSATLTDIGITGGALSISGGRATFYWDEINDAALLKAGKPLAYVPQEIKTLDADPNGLQWSFERGGWLAGLLVEEFTDAARVNRGSALGAGANDVYSLKYGRSDRRQWYTDEALEDDDAWSVSPAASLTPGVNSGGDRAASLIDFLAQRPDGAIFSGASMLNLYTDNAGDSVTLLASALAGTNARVRLTTHKFLTPDPSVLFGG